MNQEITEHYSIQAPHRYTDFLVYAKLGSNGFKVVFYNDQTGAYRYIPYINIEERNGKLITSNAKRTAFSDLTIQQDTTFEPIKLGDFIDHLDELKEQNKRKDDNDNTTTYHNDSWFLRMVQYLFSLFIIH